MCTKRRQERKKVGIKRWKGGKTKWMENGKKCVSQKSFVFFLDQVSWVRQSDLHILTSGPTAYTSDTRFKAHHSSATNDWILEIQDLKWTDAGSFLFLLSPSFSLLLSLFSFPLTPVILDHFSLVVILLPIITPSTIFRSLRVSSSEL